MTTKLNSQLREFHAEFQHHIQSVPAVPPDEVVRLRARLIAGESFEFLEAVLAEPHRTYVRMIKEEVKRICAEAALDVDMVAAADAFADVDYVVEGSRVSFGIDGEPIADEVHRSNMAKAGGGKDKHGKTLKPAGWTPPDIERELRRQGWQGGAK